MSSEIKTFTVGGIVTHDGNTKVRFANDLVRRVKIFSKSGSTRIDFVELPHAMTKVEILKYLLAHPNFSSEDDQATINDALEDRTDTPKTAKITVVQKGAAPSLDSIKARGPRKTASTETTVQDVLAAVTAE